jgi:hypothetical protein
MIALFRGARVLLLVFVVAGAASFTASSQAADAQLAATCSPPKYPGLGYFTSLTVKHTSCSTGRKFVVAYYHCRVAKGPAGRCVKRVMGYACQERRTAIATEIDARVTCTNGSKRIVHSYQQNTH